MEVFEFLFEDGDADLDDGEVFEVVVAGWVE